MGSRLPLVVILGSTGTGKTKLSLELAQKFGGEIIGADSMQVYKSLDIITAKATKEEQSVAPHHLIDILEPNETCTVLEYRNKAVSIIDDLFSKNKMPIVVGGTNYYIESLLWKILVEHTNKLLTKPGILPNNEQELPSEELHKKLKLLDPAMANRLHPQNKRKILRSLEVLYQKGKKLSEIFDEQRSSKGGSLYGGGLRYENALIFWLKCEQETLDKRLDDRVDKMVEEGLVKELTSFHSAFNSDSEPDYTRGVFQSIGFKEFHSYLVLNEEERKSEMGIKKLNEGIELLKLVTRRYARKQNKWTMNRFLGRNDRKVPPIYALDTSDVACWTSNVTVPAIDVVQSFMWCKECEVRPLQKITRNSKPNAEDETFNCEVCDRVFVGKFQWEVHRKSNNHRKRLEGRKKQKEQDKG